MSTIHYDYPYRLRMFHQSYCAVRVERKGRWIVIDPSERPRPEEIVVLTGSGLLRVKATLEAVRAGVNPTVVAPDPILDWLRKEGRLEGGPPPQEIEGVKIEAMAYTPIKEHRPFGQTLLASLTSARPKDTLRKIAERMRIPEAEPQIVQITFPDNTRMLHLDLSLHAETDPVWVERAQARFAGADWLLVGCPFGGQEAVERMIPNFKPKKCLVSDLQNQERRELGLPVELITPVRDHLQALGVEAHVFAPQAGYRFE